MTHPMDSLLLLGSSAAVLLALSLIVRFRDNPAANLWLLVFLFTTVAGIWLKFLDNNDRIVDFPHLYRWNHPIGLCRPVALYLYVWHVVNPGRRLGWRSLLHFIPVGVLVLYLAPVYTLSAEDKLAILERRIHVPSAHLPGWYSMLGIAYSILYWVLSVLAYQNSELRALGNRASEASRKVRAWIVGILVISLLGVLLPSAVALVSAGETTGNLFFQSLSALMVVACVGLLSSTRWGARRVSARYERSSLTETTRHTHAEQLRQLLEVEQLYRQPDLRVADLARRLGQSEHAVSQIINEEFGVGFPELLNHYRVEAARRLLVSPEHTQFSTEGVGQEAGFGSRATFYSVFKRLTGSTPAQFRRQHSN
jgi:AraC-like DNA-binding protein